MKVGVFNALEGSKSFVKIGLLKLDNIAVVQHYSDAGSHVSCE